MSHPLIERQTRSQNSLFMQKCIENLFYYNSDNFSVLIPQNQLIYRKETNDISHHLKSLIKDWPMPKAYSVYGLMGSQGLVLQAVCWKAAESRGWNHGLGGIIKDWPMPKAYSVYGLVGPQGLVLQAVCWKAAEGRGWNHGLGGISALSPTSCVTLDTLHELFLL